MSKVGVTTLLLVSPLGNLGLGHVGRHHPLPLLPQRLFSHDTCISTGEKDSHDDTR